MAWQQIPYPPDRRPLETTQEPIVLEGRGLRVEFDPMTGDVTRLQAPSTGLDFLEDDGRLTFRLMSAEHLWLEGGTVTPSEVRAVTGERVDVVYVRPEREGIVFPVRLMLSYVLAAGGDQPAELTCSYTIEHIGAEGQPDAGTVERVQFPVLQGLTDASDPTTELLLPFIGGERRPAPLEDDWGAFEYIYPNEAMSWMLYHFGGKGMYLASEDPEFRWTVMRGRTLAKRDPKRLEVLFETCPYLLEDQTAESQRFVLWPYEGTWHTAADRYRAWLETWWAAPEMPDDVRELRALVELFFEMPYSDGRVVKRSADELFDYMARCHDEMGLDVAHICGYHKGGFDAEYPLYEPLEDIGGADGIRQFAARCNGQEGWTTDIYINCRITDIETEWWADAGREWACREKDDTILTEFYNGRYFSVACPSVEERKQFWLDKIEEITRGYGVMGLQVDQPHTTARECWGDHGHFHHTPFDHWGAGYIDMFRRIREQLTQGEPRIWSWGEAASDVFSQFFDWSCCYVRYPDQRVAFGETDPATRNWVHDWRGYGMPELFRYCCPEVPVLQAPRISGDDPEDLFTRLNIMFMYSTMLYWPSLSVEYDLDRVPEEFRSYVKHLWDARHELRDTMIHGRFRDAVGLAVEGDEVYSKLYVSAPSRDAAITVVAINRSRDAEAQVKLSVDPKVLTDDRGAGSWRWREVALREPTGQAGGGLTAAIAIPANRVAAVELRPD